MDEASIKQLEQRYQQLRRDFEAGKLDEAAFVAEVDKLQFQDHLGRYWMIGAQSGNWHYYDGQAWHQADPRQADNLPFVDEYGRYWQKGVKSGEWYYYRPETGEWVKPDQAEVPGFAGYAGAGPSAGAPAQGAAPSAAGGIDAELYQDDEGRYWAIGRKTGQWYFYDYDGWHPAHEFRGGGTAAQPPQMEQMHAVGPQEFTRPYQPAPQPPAGEQPPQTGYYVQAQPVTSPSQPIQIYITPPQTESGRGPAGQPPADQPATPQTAPAPQPPPAPVRQGEGGSWYYFDGEKWLRYGGDETAPPPPAEAVEPKAKPAAEPASEARPKAEPAAEKVEAELFEDEPPVEVVDVEVITVIEPEPEPEPASAPTPPQPAVEEPPAPQTEKPADEIPPRRRPTQPTPTVEDRGTERRPRRPSEPVPRRRDAAQEPTLILPTDASAPRPSRPRRRTGDTQPVRPPVARQQRARQDTVPMETVGPDTPTRSDVAHQPTQPIPPARETGVAPAGREETGPTRPMPAQSAEETVTAESRARLPLGEMFRSLPSTFWTFAGGLVLLLACAFGLIFTWSWFQGNDLPAPGLVAEASPTPTLETGPPNATPTPGPTPTPIDDVTSTATPMPVTTFTGKALGVRLDYPEAWQMKDDDSCAIFSPSEDGLDPAELKDAAFWICKADDESTITDLLAQILAQFPPSAESLNEGTLSIAGQTWTSAQIRYPDDNLGGQGIATLAVTSKDGQGYYLVAAAPAERWNSVQPTFQAMINSFTFSTEQIAQAPTAEATGGAEQATPKASPEPEETGTPAATRRATATPTATPTPTAGAEKSEPQVYVVQPGDTLLAIALQFGVDADALAAKNNITNPQALQIGQELVIPASDEDVEPAVAPTSARTPAATAAATRSAATATPAPAPTATPEPQPAALTGRIVYPAFNVGSNTYDIWQLDVATGEQVVIATDASQPAFNRDGSLLAYRSWALGNTGIFFRDFVGGRSGFLTRFVEDGLPTWSPDGFSFAFASRREGDRVSRIFVGNQTGKDEISIGFTGTYPSTFPDGRLVVKGCSLQGDCGLYVMGPTGGGETKISGDTSDNAPAVSPDGTKIAFMSSGRGANNWEIWVMNADGSNPQRLTNNGSNDGLPAWSPDGQSIAYVSDQGGVWAIWVMNADGSNQRKLADMKGSPDGVVLRNQDNSKGWLEERISWAP